MADSNDPVVVKESALPAPIAAAMRYLVVIAGAIPILIQLIGAKDVAAIVAYFQSEAGVTLIASITSLATLAYGLFKTYQTKKTLVAAADAAPNDQFIVAKK